jgi:hypothetical protein
MPTQHPVLSSERFESYRKHGDTDEHALARVSWNAALSEAIYPCLQALEVAYRNRLHQSISTACGDSDWILNPSFLKPGEIDMIDAAKDDLRLRHRPLTSGCLIAELKFGF